MESHDRTYRDDQVTMHYTTKASTFVGRLAKILCGCVVRCNVTISSAAGREGMLDRLQATVHMYFQQF